jgi:hypothetical protein
MAVKNFSLYFNEVLWTGPFKYYEWYESGLKIFESKMIFQMTLK